MYKDLKAEQMMLVNEENIWDSDGKLKRPNADHQIRIIQRKAEVWEIEGLRSDKNLSDEIYGLKGVAFLKCGHFISRGALIESIKYQIDSLKQNKIYCPNEDLDGRICNKDIEMKEVRLIAGFTS